MEATTGRCSGSGTVISTTDGQIEFCPRCGQLVAVSLVGMTRPTVDAYGVTTNLAGRLAAHAVAVAA